LRAALRRRARFDIGLLGGEAVELELARRKWAAEAVGSR